MNKSETVKLLASIAAVYPNFQTQAGMLDIWVGVLAPYPVDGIQLAALDYFRGNNAFAPNPGQLISQYRSTRSRLPAYQELKKLDAPEVTPEQIERNKKLLCDLLSKIKMGNAGAI